QNQQTQDLKNVLKSNQDWADSPLPDDVKRLFNSAGNH
ncbi:TPA: chemotaxis protein, partial [Haemophilus influenzae]